MAKRQKIDNLTDSQVMDVNFFKDDLNEMYESMDKLDDLADKIDTDLNRVYFDSNNRQMIGRGVMTYASSALETLSSLRSNKITAQNSVINAKLKISQLAVNKNKNESDGVDAKRVAAEFGKIFLQEQAAKKSSPQQNVQKQMIEKINQPINTIEDNELDARIESLTQSGELQFTDNELAIKYEKRGIVFKVANSKTNPYFVACAQDTGEVLNDYPPTLLPDSSDLANGTITGGRKFVCGMTEYDIYS